LAIVVGVIVVGFVIFSNFENSSTISSEKIMNDNVAVKKIMNDNVAVKKIIDSSLSASNVQFVPRLEHNFNFFLTPGDYVRLTEQGIEELEDEVRIELKSDMMEEYDLISAPDSAVVIYPTFTAAAYSEPGFYTFFRDQCDESCITDLSFANPTLHFTSSSIATQLLYLLEYDFLLDETVDKNPEILKNYDKIILLHNEYVTKKMFDAISTHPNIIYLFPNALYAEIDVNHDEQTQTLIRGHNYPEFEIRNGFDYEIEQRFHDYEYDTDCIDWEFIEFENGYALNCYPDLMIHTDLNIALKVKELTKN
jgi:hypothetical protein